MKDATNKGGAGGHIIIILLLIIPIIILILVRSIRWGGLALVITVLEKGQPASIHRTCEDHLRCKHRLEPSVRYSAVIEFGKWREL